MDELFATQRRRTLLTALVVVFLLAFGLASVARAEDSRGVMGTRHGCVDVTATGGWDTLTSASLESQQSATTLASGLYWSELMVKSSSATVYVCETAGASCGAGTSNKISVASGATLTLPVYGLSVTSVAVYAANGTTLQVCGFFRTTP